MSEEEKKMPGAEIGIGLAVLAGGLLMRSSAHEVERFVFCEDCENWREYEPGEKAPDNVRLGVCKVNQSSFEPTEPLWPGCRGFKHRDGTPGPDKRWQESVKEKSVAVAQQVKDHDEKTIDDLVRMASSQENVDAQVANYNWLTGAPGACSWTLFYIQPKGHTYRIADGRRTTMSLARAAVATALGNSMRQHPTLDHSAYFYRIEEAGKDMEEGPAVGMPVVEGGET